MCCHLVSLLSHLIQKSRSACLDSGKECKEADLVLVIKESAALQMKVVLIGETIWPLDKHNMAMLCDITCPLVGSPHCSNAISNRLHQLKFGNFKMIQNAVFSFPATSINDRLFVEMKFVKGFLKGMKCFLVVIEIMSLENEFDK